ncbi:MAG: D-alanyl-D-alanine carboxypeptidase family protein [bacterium]
MIIKSLIIISIIFNTLGIKSVPEKFDDAVLRSEYSSANNVLAANENKLPLPTISPLPIVKADAPNQSILALRYILIDADSSIELAGKNEHLAVPIASTTKIMTATVALENYKLDDIVAISEASASAIGASANFTVGEKITVNNLLKCMLIKSANGAAIALAEHINKVNEKGTGKFVALMNEKAKSLGMKDTNYHDPAGLDVTGLSSAYDLSIITKYALKKPVFAEIVKTSKTSVTDVTGTQWHALENSNRLVNQYDYPGAIGVKTGYMDEAGHCLVGAAKRNGHTLIAVILATNSNAADASAIEARKLLDWGLTNVGWE